MTLLQLFLSFAQVGLFSFGGGMAAIPLIQSQIVEQYHWLTMTEFTDLITIAEMTPGPIAINSATFVGIRIAGIPGALIATAGCVLPACIIVSVLAWLYLKYRDMPVISGVLSGLRPAVVALIATAGATILTLAVWGENGFALNAASVDFLSLGIVAACFFVLRKWKVSPVYVMLGAGVVGGCGYLLEQVLR